MVRSCTRRAIGGYLESQQTDGTPVTRTRWYGSEGDGKCCSGVLVFCKSVENFVAETIARECNDRVVVQWYLLRELLRVPLVCGNCGW